MALLENLALGGLGGLRLAYRVGISVALLENLALGGLGGWGLGGVYWIRWPTRKPSSRRRGRLGVKGPFVDFGGLLENLTLGGLGGWEVDAKVPMIGFGGPTRKPSSWRLVRLGGGC